MFEVYNQVVVAFVELWLADPSLDACKLIKSFYV